LSICSNTSLSWSPRKIEMIAGGASLAPEAMVVVGRRDREAQDLAVLRDGADDGRREDEELRVVVRVVAGVQQVLAGVGGHRPVVVLAAAVDAGERLLVEQADQAVMIGDLAQHLHDQVLVVGREVGILEDRRDLVLARRHLVVTRADRDAELEQLRFHFAHAGEHAIGDRAEVLVFQLLALGRRRAKSVRPQVIRSGRA
jgi:hypothetical protein